MSTLLRLSLILVCLGTPACRADDAVPAASTRPAAAAPLRKAREMLRLAEETRDRIRRELEALRASGKNDPALEADYQTYLERVGRMAETYAQIVREMEALAGPAGAEESPEPDPGAGLDSTATPGILLPDEDGLDPIRALDRELSAALSDFDKILLKEHAEIGAKMEEVAQSNNEKLQELAQQAAEAAAKIKDKQAGQAGGKEGKEGKEGAETAAKGTEPGAEGAETAGNPPGEKGAEAGGKPGGAGQKPGEKGGEPGEIAGAEAGGAANGGSTGAGQGGASTTVGKPGSETNKGGRKIVRPGAEDDDIVARQLREAAEAETDPVMKDKLWKEYDEYKKSSRR